MDHSRCVNVDGIPTFYLHAGSGHPLVLIHGAAPGACAQLTWKPNLLPLAKAGFAVYAYDQPGFGHTPPAPDHSLEYRVAHARAFINALGLERYHLIGNSVGAYLAARLALEDERVAGLVLVASSTLAPPGSTDAQAMARRHSQELREFTPSLEHVRELSRKTFYHAELATEAFVQERYAMSSGWHFEAQQRRREAPAPAPILHLLPSLRPKTLILWGNNDQGAAVERALLLLRLIPGAELHVFDRCAHWVQWDQAARFNRLVADFLSSVR